MANKQIPALPPLDEAPADDDRLAIRDTSSGSDKSLRVDRLDDRVNERGFAQSVDSVSTLRTSTFPASLERLWLSGYYGVGTPGGGPLYRDSEDTTTTDNGGTVFVDGEGVRWKRAFEGTVSVTWFGARGDGAADDTAVIQAAFMSQLPLYVDAGVYRISNTLTLPHPFNIQGAGAETSVFQFEGMGGFAGLDGIVIQQGQGRYEASALTDLTLAIKGSHGRYGISTPRGSEIFNTNPPRYVFERLVFRGDVEDPVLFGLFDYGWARYIDLGDSRDAVIKTCLFLGCYDYRVDPSLTNSTSTAIYISGKQDEGGVLMPLVDHVYTHYCGRSVEFGFRVSNPLIRENQWHRCYQGLVSSHAGAGADYGVLEAQVHNCNINAQLRGVYVERSAFLDISGVRVTRAADGFDHADTWYGYYFPRVDELKLSGWRAYNAGAYTNEHVGLYLGAGTPYGKITDGHVYAENAGGLTKGLQLVDIRFAKISGVSSRNTNTMFSIETASSGSPEIALSGVQAGPGVTNKYHYDAGVGRQNILLLDARGYSGVDSTVTATSEAGTTTLTSQVDNQVKRFAFNTGEDYTYNIDISNTHAREGDTFVLHLTLAASGPTVQVRDAALAVQVELAPTGATERYRVEMAYTGAAWRCIGASLSSA